MKNKIKRFLVTGANGGIGEAVARILKESYVHVDVIGTDVSEDWPGMATCDSMLTLPRGDDASYIDSLKEAVVQEKIDCIIPTTEVELRRISTECVKNIADLPLLMTRADLILPFFDKYLTYQWLSQHNLNPPWTTLLTEARVQDLPFIVKPRSGRGSVGVEVVKTSARLQALQESHGDAWIAQEYLDVDDQEFTCAILSHGTNFRFLVMNRVLDGGHTVRATVERVHVITEMLREISDVCALDGVLNVQLRMVDGHPRIFEINPRLSSTLMMRHKMGFQDLVWWLGLSEGIAPPSFEPKPGLTVYRLSREVVRWK